MSDIKLIKEDVSICPIDDTECENCGVTATHSVMLDLRGNGGGIGVGHFCETCATEATERIRATLPSEAETEELVQLRAERDDLKAKVGQLEKALRAALPFLQGCTSFGLVGSKKRDALVSEINSVIANAALAGGKK